MDNQGKLWTRSYITLLIMSFASQITYFMLYSTINLYAKHLSSDEFLIGLTISGFMMAALVAKLFTTKIMEIVPVRLILACSFLAQFVSFLGCYMATSIHFLIVMRMLNGFANGFSVVTVATVISYLVPRSRLLEANSYNMMLVTLATAIGPLLAFELCHNDGAQYRPVFLLLMGIILVALILSVTLRVSVKDDTPVEMAGTAEQGRTHFNLATAILMLLFLIGTLSQSSIQAYLGVYASESGLGSVSMYFTCFAATNFGFRLVMPKVMKVVTERQLLFVNAILAIATFLLVYFATSVIWIYIAGLIYGVAMGIYYPVMTTKVVCSMARSKQGFTNTLSNATLDLGSVLGIMLWSTIASATGNYHMLYLVATGIAVVHLILLTIYPKILKHFDVEEVSAA